MKPFRQSHESIESSVSPAVTGNQLHKILLWVARHSDKGEGVGATLCHMALSVGAILLGGSMGSFIYGVAYGFVNRRPFMPSGSSTDFLIWLNIIAACSVGVMFMAFVRGCLVACSPIKHLAIAGILAQIVATASPVVNGYVNSSSCLWPSLLGAAISIVLRRQQDRLQILPQTTK